MPGGISFVRDVPQVEIIDGMVHITTEQGEWYWLPSTFGKYLEAGRRALVAFHNEQRAAVPFRKRG